MPGKQKISPEKFSPDETNPAAFLRFFPDFFSLRLLPRLVQASKILWKKAETLKPTHLYRFHQRSDIISARSNICRKLLTATGDIVQHIGRLLQTCSEVSDLSNHVTQLMQTTCNRLTTSANIDTDKS